MWSARAVCMFCLLKNILSIKFSSLFPVVTVDWLWTRRKTVATWKAVGNLHCFISHRKNQFTHLAVEPVKPAQSWKEENVAHHAWTLFWECGCVISNYFSLVSIKPKCCAYVITLIHSSCHVLFMAIVSFLPEILFPLLAVQSSNDVCMNYFKVKNDNGY